MPIMRGRDAVRHIREMGYKGRIFGVTGNVLQSDIDDFKANGADLVILKPMSIDKFKQAMEETARV
jgi:CheY-like chemotaxis protein